ncbi:hypothetical protein TNIN_2611 [Trichonephila inaurata madagascariensis]|uniref:Uncharacterized protein n=1 Tax=Trichonephila inaurata madagascariensis TaxID=2747483 RepID=A0A8X6MB57_9ARAC|nr:hypothetical protein TNIN_2611 [Trichonephila inaurata madagascariensis]
MPLPLINISSDYLTICATMTYTRVLSAHNPKVLIIISFIPKDVDARVESHNIRHSSMFTTNRVINRIISVADVSQGRRWGIILRTSLICLITCVAIKWKVCGRQ